MKQMIQKGFRLMTAAAVLFSMSSLPAVSAETAGASVPDKTIIEFRSNGRKG